MAAAALGCLGFDILEALLAFVVLPVLVAFVPLVALVAGEGAWTILMFGILDGEVEVRLPNGAVINPGLVADFYSHGFSQSFVDQMIPRTEFLYLTLISVRTR